MSLTLHAIATVQDAQTLRSERVAGSVLVGDVEYGTYARCTWGSTVSVTLSGSTT